MAAITTEAANDQERSVMATLESMAQATIDKDLETLDQLCAAFLLHTLTFSCQTL